MKHLSGLDATFLHFETPEMPMHVGALTVLDLPKGYRGEFYEDAKAHMASRLHLAEVFTRKLALMPFDLSNPVWVEDEDIDLEYHVRHVTLSKPGSNRQLQQYVGRLHSMLLDRSRPLWEVYIIEGLKGGQIALYLKLHHAGIDGQAGVELGKAIFDDVPSGRAIQAPRPRQVGKRYQLGMAELASAAVRNTAAQYVKLAKMAPALARAIAGLARPVEREVSKTEKSSVRRFKMFAPRTSLNVQITNQRNWAGRTIPLAEAKRIAKHFGVSLNDVVMATVSGALRRYLVANNELPDQPLVAGVPVSLREAGDNTANNQVSMILVALASDTADPVQRLRQINAASSSAKTTMNRFRTVAMDDFPMFGAPWVLSGLASMLGRSGLANLLPPSVNLVISNVAGSPTPLYFAGALLTCYYPVSIPSHGMALNATVQSYNGRMDYGLIACRRAVPDLNEIGDHLLDEHRLMLALTSSQPDLAATNTAKGTEPQPKPSARRARAAAPQPAAAPAALGAPTLARVATSARTVAAGRKADAATPAKRKPASTRA